MPSAHSKLSSSLKLSETKESKKKKRFQQAARNIESIFDQVETFHASYSPQSLRTSSEDQSPHFTSHLFPFVSHPLTPQTLVQL